MTDDITQQGFGRRCHHGEGISMETLGPLSRHRFMLPPHPSLLRGPSDGRDQDTAQAPEINCVPVLYHPYSSHEAFHLLPLFCSGLALKLNLSTIPLTPFQSNCQLLTCATIKSEILKQSSLCYFAILYPDNGNYNMDGFVCF